MLHHVITYLLYDLLTESYLKFGFSIDSYISRYLYIYTTAMMSIINTPIYREAN